MINLLAVLTAAAAWVTAVIYGLRIRRITIRLDRMLDDALSGQFEEKTFDESMVSRLEQKLGRFLAASRLTATAIETDRAKVQTLIGDISHQTKTPLSNILLYAQLMEEQPLPKSALPLAAQITLQAQRLGFLITSLIKTSRLENGVIQVHPAINNLGDLLLGLERQYRPSAEAKGVSLHIDKPELTAVFDPKWTAEAIGNLLDNAVKYTPAGGNITVTAGNTTMFSQVTVTDTGPGIPEEEHGLVFTRFYRGKNVRSEEGVGLGLYLSRQIIAAEGGYLRLRSSPGKGTSMSVFLSREAL